MCFMRLWALARGGPQIWPWLPSNQLKKGEMMSPMSHTSVGKKQLNDSWNLDQRKISSTRLHKEDPCGIQPAESLATSSQKKWQIPRGYVLSLVSPCNIIPQPEFSKNSLQGSKGGISGSLCIAGLTKGID